MTLATEIDYLLLGQIVATWLVRSQRVCLCWKTRYGFPISWGPSNCSFYLSQILVENCHFFADTIWQHPDYWSGEIWVSDWLTGKARWRLSFRGISGPEFAYLCGGFLSHGGTPKNHPWKNGVFHEINLNKPSIFRYPHGLGNPYVDLRMGMVLHSSRGANAASAVHQLNQTSPSRLLA